MEKNQKENPREENEDSSFSGYKCFKCKGPVNFMFIMGFIKKSGLCPDCYWEENK
jgi:hypothetical protein